MITRSLLLILACTSCFLVIPTLLPKTIAARITPNVDEFMIENHRTRTRTRQNYMIQRALDDELSANVDNLVPMLDAIDTETNPEGQSSQIVDYANMIRNDIIFLDNSVETTTQEKGNIKKKNIAIAVPPCNCGAESDTKYLGENFFPSKLQTLKCLESRNCPEPYHCKANYYWVIVLERVTTRQSRISHIPVPADFHARWVAHRVNVTTSCICTGDN